MEYDYAGIKEKYGSFTYPMVSLKVGDKLFSDNKNKLVLGDVVVDLSTGYEASVASFSIYNVYDTQEKQYLFSKCREYMTLGSAVSLFMGYADQMTEIFVGFISQVRFVHPAGGIHHVEVTAMDVKGLMMANSFARQMASANYSDAVKEIFRKPLYQRMNAEGIYRELKITDTPDKKNSTQGQETSVSIEMVSESDYEFVVKAAKRFNYEFYVDTGVVCFCKAKAVGETCLMKLGMNHGLQTYDISYDMTGLVKSVEVRGMDTARGVMVSATKKVSNRISTGSKAKALIGQTKRVVIDANAISKEQAEYRAESLMEDISYRFGTLECVCMGIPELKPGHYIKITELGAPCDNSFYITHTKHVMTDTYGYHTQITAIAAALT